jgi:hypothetical protein
MRRAEFVGVLEPGNGCAIVAWFVTAGAAVVLLVEDDEVCASADATANARATTPNADAVILGKVLIFVPPDCRCVTGTCGTRSIMLIAARKLALNRGGFRPEADGAR